MAFVQSAAPSSKAQPGESIALADVPCVRSDHVAGATVVPIDNPISEPVALLGSNRAPSTIGPVTYGYWGSISPDS